MKIPKRSVSGILAIIMLMNVIFPAMTVFAQELDSSKVITGKYQYSASEGNNKQNQNTFLYRDDCFTRSSYLGCQHLEALSMQVAAASISWYGPEEDPYEIQTENNAYNLVNLLGALEFEDIGTNTYYDTEKRENSVGVAVGHKTIIQEGNPYTLLAIIPRSAGYKQEWVGDFDVGDGMIHVGFKAARDEILRFVKQYINEYEIEGSLKVWICGYSRGAAIADMLGGFFAGGGIGYFGDTVSITPEDVYCYTIGTPTSIKNGASKNEELSVEGNRDEEQYADDTPGEAYEYTAGGTFVEGSEVYQGIKNLISLGDPFALLPPSEWDFTRYGTPIDPNLGLSSEEDMLEELEKISPYMYNMYAEDGAVKPFNMKTFDVKNLSMIDTGEVMLPAEFVQERLDAVTRVIETNEQAVEEHYLDAMKSLLGVYGMTAVFTTNGLSTTEEIDTSSATEALVYAILDFAAKAMVEKGLAEDEEEGVILAVKEVLEFALEEDIDLDTMTIDDFVAIFAQFITENEAVGDAVVSMMESNIPENYRSLIGPMLGSFHPDYDTNEDLTVGEILKAYVKACYLGPDPESSAAENCTDAAMARSLLYTVLYMVLYSNLPEITTLLLDDDYNADGHGLVKDFISMLLQYMLTEKDDEGQVIQEYTLVEKADIKLLLLLDNLMPAVMEECEALYGEEYCAMLDRQVIRLEANIAKAREFLMLFFFGSENGFDVPQIAQTVSTLYANLSILPLEHLDEIYLAKSRNSQRYEKHAYYSVTFDAKNGQMNEEEENPISVLEGETVQEPSNPTRKGYNFKGWFTDEKCKNAFDFETPIWEDITLYAKWTKKSSSSGSSSNAGASASASSSSTESGESSTQEEVIEPVSGETNVDEVIVKEPTIEETPIIETWTNVDEWAKEEMVGASKKGLIPKTLSNKDYTNAISREEFAATCVKLYEAFLGSKVEKEIENPFFDTNEEAVIVAYQLGITNGVSETEFGNGTITREQMATMLTRTLQKVGIDTQIDLEQVEKFNDDDTLHDWGREAVYFMASREIIKGVGNNTFFALGNSKIEEALAISYRCLMRTRRRIDSGTSIRSLIKQ